MNQQSGKYIFIKSVLTYFTYFILKLHMDYIWSTYVLNILHIFTYKKVHYILNLRLHISHIGFIYQKLDMVYNLYILVYDSLGYILFASSMYRIIYFIWILAAYDIVRHVRYRTSRRTYVVGCRMLYRTYDIVYTI